MTYDFKKECKDLYLPKTKPMRIEVPAMTFIAVAGTGDPNAEDGTYAEALGLLYALSYAIKMAKKGDWQPEGYFDYTVPPLEGLWWGGEGAFDGASIGDKAALSWVSLIRQPDFVTPEVFAWARDAVTKKKSELADALTAGCARLVRFAEGPCAQVMHKGPYDNEPATIAALSAFIAEEGLVEDIAVGGESPAGHAVTAPFDPEGVLDALDVDGAVPSVRLHHEIYLGDPRRTKPENLKTVIRHPVRARQEDAEFTRSHELSTQTVKFTLSREFGAFCSFRLLVSSRSRCANGGWCRLLRNGRRGLRGQGPRGRRQVRFLGLRWNAGPGDSWARP